MKWPWVSRRKFEARVFIIREKEGMVNGLVRKVIDLHAQQKELEDEVRALRSSSTGSQDQRDGQPGL